MCLLTCELSLYTAVLCVVHHELYIEINSKGDNKLIFENKILNSPLTSLLYSLLVASSVYFTQLASDVLLIELALSLAHSSGNMVWIRQNWSVIQCGIPIFKFISFIFMFHLLDKFPRSELLSPS